MPHDKNGKLLAVGDIVSARFTITQIQPGDEYCNLSCSTIEPMFPGEYLSSMTFNAKQVEKEEKLDVRLQEPEDSA